VVLPFRIRSVVAADLVPPRRQQQHDFLVEILETAANYQLRAGTRVNPTGYRSVLGSSH
jgi:hypothetical protein